MKKVVSCKNFTQTNSPICSKIFTFLQPNEKSKTFRIQRKTLVVFFRIVEN